jgi:hypothetical protein
MPLFGAGIQGQHLWLWPQPRAIKRDRPTYYSLHPLRQHRHHGPGYCH